MGFFERRPNFKELLSDQIRTELADPKYAFFLAFQDQEAIGLIQADYKDNPTIKFGKNGFVSRMFVKEGSRRSKVANSLVQAAFSWFRAKKVYNIDALVFKDNEAGNTFWESQGFKNVLFVKSINLGEME